MGFLIAGMIVVLVIGVFNGIFAERPARGPWNDYAPGTGAMPVKPVAIPAPGPYVRPPYYPVLPQPQEPQREPSKVEPIGWGVDDTSGPWPSAEIGPASARADRLLRRLHKAQGLEVGP